MFIFATVRNVLNEKFMFEIQKADMDSCTAVYVRFIIFPMTTANISGQASVILVSLPGNELTFPPLPNLLSGQEFDSRL